MSNNKKKQNKKTTKPPPFYIITSPHSRTPLSLPPITQDQLCGVVMMQCVECRNIVFIQNTNKKQIPPFFSHYLPPLSFFSFSFDTFSPFCLFHSLPHLLLKSPLGKTGEEKRVHQKNTHSLTILPIVALSCCCS